MTVLVYDADGQQISGVYDVCCSKHFTNPFLIVLAFFLLFLSKKLSPFKHSPVPSGLPCLLKREKNWKKMRIQFTFATPLKALKTAEVALFLVRKICEKRKKEEDGDFWYILLPTWLLFMMPAASTFFLILSDTPRLFSFLKRKSFIPGFVLCHKWF